MCMQWFPLTFNWFVLHLHILYIHVHLVLKCFHSFVAFVYMCMYVTLQTHIILHHCHSTFIVIISYVNCAVEVTWPVCSMFTCMSLIVMIQNTVYNPCWQTHVQWNLANLNPEIRTPPHSGHILWSQFCMLTNPWNQDTSIKLTPEMVPWVSGLERFLCTCMYTVHVCIHVWMCHVI